MRFTVSIWLILLGALLTMGAPAPLPVSSGRGGSSPSKMSTADRPFSRRLTTKYTDS